MRNKIKHSLDKRLQGLQMSDSLRHIILTRAASTGPRRQRSSKISLRLALVLILLAATLTVFAITRGFGLFDLMGTVMPHFSVVRPEAEELLRHDLAFYSFEHVDVAIREAAYDGRYLRVAYSVTDRAATRPLDKPGESLTSGRPDIYQFDAALQDGIWWSTLDWAEVGGEDVNPKGMSFSVAGPNNGEAVTWVQFDVQDIDLPDPFTVRLPIRGSGTPEELIFTMDKSGMNHVFYLKPPPDKRIGSYVARVREVMVSPIRVYITLHLIVDPGLSPDEVWKITNPWGSLETVLSDADGSNPREFTDTGIGPIDNMASFMRKKEDGNLEFEDRITDPEKPVTMLVVPEFSPPDQYPEAFRLGFDEDNYIIIPFERLDEAGKP